MSKSLLGLILSVIFSCTSAHAEVYRWTDEQGNVHFGDKAHANSRAQHISEDIKLKNIDHSAAITQQRLQQIDLRQQAHSVEIQQRQAQHSDKTRRLHQACQDAKQRLNILQGRVIFLDDEGNEVKRSEQERRQRANALQHDIKNYCR